MVASSESETFLPLDRSRRKSSQEDRTWCAKHWYTNTRACAWICSIHVKAGMAMCVCVPSVVRWRQVDSRIPPTSQIVQFSERLKCKNKLERNRGHTGCQSLTSACSHLGTCTPHTCTQHAPHSGSDPFI